MVNVPKTQSSGLWVNSWGNCWRNIASAAMMTKWFLFTKLDDNKGNNNFYACLQLWWPTTMGFRNLWWECQRQAPSWMRQERGSPSTWTWCYSLPSVSTPSDVSRIGSCPASLVWTVNAWEERRCAICHGRITGTVRSLVFFFGGVFSFLFSRACLYSLHHCYPSFSRIAFNHLFLD